MTNTPAKGSPRIIEQREHQTIISLGEVGHHGFPVAAYDVHNDELVVTVSNEALATLTYALANTKANLHLALDELARNGTGTILLRYEYNERQDSTVARLKGNAAEAGRKEGRKELLKALGYGEYPGGAEALLLDLSITAAARKLAADEDASAERLRQWGIRVQED